MIHSVAVIGAGIAGAAAALRLAQGGVRPLWIAAEHAHSFKPGEHLSAAAVPMLKSLGADPILLSEVHRRAHSTYSAWGSETLTQRNAIAEVAGPPIVLDRVAFEAALSEKAIMAGAQRITEDVADIRVDQGQWHLDTGKSLVKASFLFDATGRKAIVASKFATRFQADKLSCQYAVFTQSHQQDPRPVTLIEAEEHGWWYMSVRADRRVVLNFFTDADLPGLGKIDLDTRVRTTKCISVYLSDYGYAIASAPRRITTNSSWIAPAIGEGWVAIGDASAAFDPLSSHGMTTALWSALRAADAFIDRDRQKMQAYAKSVAGGVQDYLTAKHRMYSAEDRWPDSPFWARRHREFVTEPHTRQSGADNH